MSAGTSACQLVVGSPVEDTPTTVFALTLVIVTVCQMLYVVYDLTKTYNRKRRGIRNRQVNLMETVLMNPVYFSFLQFVCLYFIAVMFYYLFVHTVQLRAALGLAIDALFTYINNAVVVFLFTTNVHRFGNRRALVFAGTLAASRVAIEFWLVFLLKEPAESDAWFPLPYNHHPLTQTATYATLNRFWLGYDLFFAVLYLLLLFVPQVLLKLYPGSRWARVQHKSTSRHYLTLMSSMYVLYVIGRAMLTAGVSEGFCLLGLGDLMYNALFAPVVYLTLWADSRVMHFAALNRMHQVAKTRGTSVPQAQRLAKRMLRKNMVVTRHKNQDDLYYTAFSDTSQETEGDEDGPLVGAALDEAYDELDSTTQRMLDALDPEMGETAAENHGMPGRRDHIALFRQLQRDPLLAKPSHEAWGTLNYIAHKDLEFGRLLGTGAFGRVYEGLWQSTPVAIKRVQLRAGDLQLSQELIDEFKSELMLMSTLRHSNVILFMGASVQPPFMDLVMELAANRSLTALLDYSVREEQRRFDSDSSAESESPALSSGAVHQYSLASSPSVGNLLSGVSEMEDMSWGGTSTGATGGRRRHLSSNESERSRHTGGGQSVRSMRGLLGRMRSEGSSDVTEQLIGEEVVHDDSVHTVGVTSHHSQGVGGAAQHGHGYGRSNQSQRSRGGLSWRRLMNQGTSNSTEGGTGSGTRTTRMQSSNTQASKRSGASSRLRRRELNYGWPMLLRMAEEVATGMVYLHSKGVLHRDLKTMNVLVDHYLTCKISDFGLSRVLEGEASATTFKGTPQYMAPEVIKGQAYGMPADVYAFGVVLAEMLTRTKPYRGVRPLQIIYAVANENKRPELPKPSRDCCPPSFIELIEECWQTEPELRPTFAQVLERLREFRASVEYRNLTLPRVDL